MPSTRDIRRRIKSVKGTTQITKAMQMEAMNAVSKVLAVVRAGEARRMDGKEPL